MRLRARAEQKRSHDAAQVGSSAHWVAAGLLRSEANELPVQPVRLFLGGATGLEPATPGTTTQCASQLRHAPHLTSDPEGSPCTPGRIRTSGPRLRRPLLCPLSYGRLAERLYHTAVQLGSCALTPFRNSWPDGLRADHTAVQLGGCAHPRLRNSWPDGLRADHTAVQLGSCTDSRRARLLRPSASPQRQRSDHVEALEAAGSHRLPAWSERRESNPHHWLGRPVLYH